MVEGWSSAACPGFEVELAASGVAELHVFDAPSLAADGRVRVSFARDPTTGSGAVLLGDLHYVEELAVADLGRRLSPHSASASDATIALEMYRRHGVQGLRELEGDFSMILFDGARSTLILCRDPMGAWPLYWREAAGAARAGTSLRSLAAWPSRGSVDREYLARFLAMPYISFELGARATAIAPVQRVLSGEIVELRRDAPARVLSRWDWLEQAAAIAPVRREEAVDRFGALLQAAVLERTRRGRFIAHLSGGLDSSSIVCLLDRAVGDGTVTGPVRTVSLVYRMSSLAGETEYIRRVVDATKNVEPIYRRGDAALDFDWFRDGVPPHDEPYQGLFRVALDRELIQTARKCRAHTIFDGTGAEFAAQGNRLHLADMLRNGRMKTLLSTARLMASASRTSLWSVLRRYAVEPNLPPQLRGGLATLLRRGRGRWPNLNDFSIPDWILPSFVAETRMWRRQCEATRDAHHYPHARSFRAMEYRFFTGSWSAWYLAAPFGIRCCRPFGDPRLLAFCLSVPDDLHESPDETKPLLQAALRGVLPEEVRTRRWKRHFNEIYSRGLTRNLAQLERMVYDSKIDELELFDTSRLVGAIREHALGRGELVAAKRINVALAVIAWYIQRNEAVRHPCNPLHWRLEPPVRPL